MSLGLALSCLACSKYDDSTLNDRLAKLEQRVGAIEEKVKVANEDIKTLKSLVSASTQGKTITEVKKTDEGYDLIFSDKQVISIKHGRNGADGHRPQISVAQENGVYYWQLDGQWLLDAQNKKVRVSGETGPVGPQGAQGVAGQDGKTPTLRINAGKWEVAYGDNDWKEVPGSADATLGGATVEGLDLFKKIELDGDNVVITLKSGDKIKLPKEKKSLSIPIHNDKVIGDPNNIA